MTTATASEHLYSVIFKYAARISQAQDSDMLLGLNADMARDLVGADRCSIWLLDEQRGELHTKVAHGVDEIRVGIGQGLVGACVSSGQPIVVNDTAAEERFLNRVDKASGYITQSVLVIPLRGTRGEVLGAFQALNKPGGFNQADVDLLGLAGSYSASAIEAQRLRVEAESARVLMRELEIAREVQAGLLPAQTPRSGRFEAAAFCRAAKFVGGDYYDFIQPPDGRLVFTLGDVSGKGIPAAVMMASIQASLRVQLLAGGGLLPDVLADLNRSVYASSTPGRYSTLFCGSMDTTAASLTYVNAGQCSPMLVRARGGVDAIERLTAGGTPVGLLPMARYEAGSVSLSAGDLLLCFSDGISEAVNPAEDFWTEADIEAVLKRSSGKSAHEVAQAVISAADAFADGAEQADDMTVVVIRILG